MNEEQRKLVEENHNLIYSFLLRNHLDVEEFYDLAAIGLCKAAMTFDKDISRFATYAYKCMHNEIRMYHRHNGTQRVVPDKLITYYEAEIKDSDGDISNFLAIIPSDFNLEDVAVSNMIYDEFLSKLSDRDKTVLYLLNDGHTQAEVSKILGCSPTLISKFRKKFTTLLKKLGLEV